MDIGDMFIDFSALFGCFESMVIEVLANGLVAKMENLVNLGFEDGGS